MKNYSIQEFAALFGVSEESARLWIAKGHLRATRLPVGRSPWLIPKSEAERFARAAGISLKPTGVRS